MEWIEYIVPEGGQPEGRQLPEGYRTKMPYREAKSLVLAGVAEFVDGPHPSRDGPGLPRPPIDAVDWTDINGIGDEKAEEIEDWLEEQGIEAAGALRDGDLTDIPGVGPDLADEVGAMLLPHLL